MFCPNCGNQIPDGSKFCGKCGKPLPQMQSAPAPQPQPPTQTASGAPTYGAVAKSKGPGKFFLIAGIILAILITLLILFFTGVFGGGQLSRIPAGTYNIVQSNSQNKLEIVVHEDDRVTIEIGSTSTTGLAKPIGMFEGSTIFELTDFTGHYSRSDTPDNYWEKVYLVVPKGAESKKLNGFWAMQVQYKNWSSGTYFDNYCALVRDDGMVACPNAHDQEVLTAESNYWKSVYDKAKAMSDPNSTSDGYLMKWSDSGDGVYQIDYEYYGVKFQVDIAQTH